LKKQHMIRDKNILFVITKLELGGAQKQLLNLIKHLDRENNNIFLFTAKSGLLHAETLSMAGLKVKKSGFLERSPHPLKDLLALCELYFFIKRNNIDIVHTHSSKAGILGRIAAWLAKAKGVVHTVHGWSFNDYQPFFVRELYIFLERLVARVTDILVVVSCHDRTKGIANHIGTIGKYVLIRYGINYSEFAGTDNGNVRKELGLTADDLVVGMVACFKPQKAPQDFIKMASLVNEVLPEVKFILIGDGILRKKIEYLIRQLKLQKQIVLLGWRRDIPRILSALDIFVLTSLWEGLPISVLEAMASSKSVVVTDTGGVREVVRENETGFLTAPKDIPAMAQRLEILLKDKGLREAYGGNSRESLSLDFHLDTMLFCTQHCYRILLEGRKVADIY